MKPSSPVVPGLSLDEIVYAQNQPPYLPLPVYRYEDGTDTALIRWHMSLWERIVALFRGDVYVWVMYYNGLPIKLQINRPRSGE